MDKQLKDYLHLYPEVEVMCVGPFFNMERDYNTRGKLVGRSLTHLSEYLVRVNNNLANYFGIYEIKPILRKLSSMTKEERLILSVDDNIINENLDGLFLDHLSPEEFRYLLSLHFDIFQLIESGLAIDASTLQPN